MLLFKKWYNYDYRYINYMALLFGSIFIGSSLLYVGSKTFSYLSNKKESIDTTEKVLFFDDEQVINSCIISPSLTPHSMSPLPKNKIISLS